MHVFVLLHSYSLLLQLHPYTQPITIQDKSESIGNINNLRTHSQLSIMHSHLLSPFISLAVLAFLPTALCHGHQVPISDDADWATRHMAEEHHIANLDPSAFFALHDYDSSGHWSPDEIRRTYGLDDESAKDVPQERKSSAVQEVVQLFDKDGDGAISRDEWMDGWVKEGKRLPDLGVGYHKFYNRLWPWSWARTMITSEMWHVFDMDCADALALAMSIGQVGVGAVFFGLDTLLPLLRRL